VENGTHVLFGARLGRYAEGETTLAQEVLGALRPGLLCLADRQFSGPALWPAAVSTGADQQVYAAAETLFETAGRPTSLRALHTIDDTLAAIRERVDK
jgi:hypothetical protein